MPMTAAIRISSPLPTMALAMPPPISPADSGSLVKKFQSRERQPLKNRKPRIRNSTDDVTSGANTREGQHDVVHEVAASSAIH